MDGILDILRNYGNTRLYYRKERNNGNCNVGRNDLYYVYRNTLLDAFGQARRICYKHYNRASVPNVTEGGK